MNRRDLLQGGLAALGLLAAGRAHAQAIDTAYYYRLTNAFLGTSRSLDTYSDGENLPFMGKTGNYSGQRWRLIPLPDGTYKLTNTFLGTSRALDTFSDGDNKPFMGKTDREYTGQHWVLRRVKPI